MNSIIVYHNPLQKMIWESNFLFQIVAFAVVTMFLVVVLSDLAFRVLPYRFANHKLTMYVVLATSFATGVYAGLHV